MFRTANRPGAQTVALMADVLDAEQPDLAVLTGDVIDGKHSRDPAAAWRYAVAPLVERGIPWAAVFGNHDDEGGMTRAELMALQRTLPYCLSVAGPRMCPASATTCCPSAPPAARKRRRRSTSSTPTATPRPRSGIRLAAARPDRVVLADGASVGRGQWRRAAARATPFSYSLSEYNEAWDLQFVMGTEFEPVCCPLINTGVLRRAARGRRRDGHVRRA